MDAQKGPTSKVPGRDIVPLDQTPERPGTTVVDGKPVTTAAAPSQAEALYGAARARAKAPTNTPPEAGAPPVDEISAAQQLYRDAGALHMPEAKGSYSPEDAEAMMKPADMAKKGLSRLEENYSPGAASSGAGIGIAIAIGSAALDAYNNHDFWQKVGAARAAVRDEHGVIKPDVFAEKYKEMYGEYPTHPASPERDLIGHLNSMAINTIGTDRGKEKQDFVNDKEAYLGVKGKSDTAATNLKESQPQDTSSLTAKDLASLETKAKIDTGTTAKEVRSQAKSQLKDTSSKDNGPSAPADNKGLAGVQTKGGFYPIYDKGSAEATDFRSAFGKASDTGASSFNWQGRDYNTNKGS